MALPCGVTKRLMMILPAFGAAACSAPATVQTSEGPEPMAVVTDSLPPGHAQVDLTGTWATGSTGEPEAKRLSLPTQCNYNPAMWVIDQRGDSVQAWVFPASQSQGVASTRVLSKVGAKGRVSGVDVVMGMTGARYVLRYDSTSEHLRGTLNGAPFWAVREQIMRPAGCLPPPGLDVSDQ